MCIRDRNRPDDSVGVEEKEYSLDDVMNFLKTMHNELSGVINKRFDKREEIMDKGFDMTNSSQIAVLMF